MPDARIPCMTTAFDDTGQHPVTSTIAAVSQLLHDIADLGLWTLPAAETEANLTALAAAAAPDHRARAPPRPPRRPPRPRRRGTVPPTPAATGPTPPGRPNATPNDACDLAHALDHDHEPVRDAMAAGQVSEEQAVVIVKGVDALPVEHRRDAEAHLIGCAAEHDPVALRRLAHRVLEVVAPEIAEAHELKALQRQEALAEEACRFTIADDGHGLCHGRFTLPGPGRCDAQAGRARDQRTQAPTALRHPEGARARVLRVRHPLPDRPAPARRRRRRHRGGHDDPGQPARRQPGTRRPSTPATRSPPTRPGSWPARPGSSRSCSVGSPRSSTSAAAAGSTTGPSGSRSGTATSTAPATAATGPPRCATSTTTPPGAAAATPTSPTDGCSAPGTTPTPTTPKYQMKTIPNGRVIFSRS